MPLGRNVMARHCDHPRAASRFRLPAHALATPHLADDRDRRRRTRGRGAHRARAWRIRHELAAAGLLERRASARRRRTSHRPAPWTTRVHHGRRCRCGPGGAPRLPRALLRGERDAAARELLTRRQPRGLHALARARRAQAGRRERRPARRVGSAGHSSSRLGDRRRDAAGPRGSRKPRARDQLEHPPNRQPRSLRPARGCAGGCECEGAVRRPPRRRCDRQRAGPLCDRRASQRRLELPRIRKAVQHLRSRDPPRRSGHPARRPRRLERDPAAAVGVERELTPPRVAQRPLLPAHLLRRDSRGGKRTAQPHYTRARGRDARAPERDCARELDPAADRRDRKHLLPRRARREQFLRVRRCGQSTGSHVRCAPASQA